MRVVTRRSRAATRATTTRTTERQRALRIVSYRQRWLLSSAVWAAACAAPVTRPVRAAVTRPVRAASAPRQHELHRSPLSDLVSAAGLHWLVLIKPAQILTEPELGQAISQIVPGRRFDAFAEASGVDLRAVPSAAVAGFPYATLYLAEVPSGVTERVRDHFRERLLTGAVDKHPRPGLVRIGGVIGQTPETLLTIDDQVIAVAVGDPLQATIVEAYAEERLKSSPTALHDAALSSLPDQFANDAAVLFAPGPFGDEWQSAAGGLLQSTVAVAIGARLDQGRLATTICLAGAWGDSAADAASRLSVAWTAFAQSSAGRLFGLRETAEVTAIPELLTLRVQLDLNLLVRGLRASVLGDVSQLLNMPNVPWRAPEPVEDPKP
jgi:hypothetical protein